MSQTQNQTQTAALQPGQPERPAANRLDLDYRTPPPRKIGGPLIDVHSHVNDVKHAAPFFEAAELYGVSHVISMTPLDNIPALREAYPDKLSFVAIPRWKDQQATDAFQTAYRASLRTFREYGAVLCKFWMAPPMRERHGLTLEHPFMRPIIDDALDLGFSFLTHIADPSKWFEPGGKYADHAKFGSKREQYDQLQWFLDFVHPRPVIGAHMGGTIEDVSFLQGLLDQHDNYFLDTSATKWIVREVSAQPDVVRPFMIRNAARILFGSDLVTADRFDFEHHASRYWTHQTLWETDYRGESPIADPDSDPPLLNGVDLPAEVLEQIYHRNAERLGLVGESRLRRVM